MAAGTALNVSLFSALSDKREMSRNYWQKYTKYTKYNNTRDTFFTITNVLLLPAKVE